MATFPATLPSPTFNSYALAPVDPTLRSDMEVGMARMRRRTADRNDHVALTWMLTDTQMAAFRTWFDDASSGCSGGASWFSITLAAGNGGMQSYNARFTGIWTAMPTENFLWSVSATLEIR